MIKSLTEIYIGAKLDRRTKHKGENVSLEINLFSIKMYPELTLYQQRSIGMKIFEKRLCELAIFSQLNIFFKSY